MSRLAPWSAVALVLLTLPACSVLSKLEEPVELYTVTPKSTFEDQLPSVDWQLVVDPPTAAAHLNSGRIALQFTPTTSDYYAHVAWIDRAPLMLQTRIVDSFENTRRIIGVGRDPVAVRANYILQSELRAFQAEYFHGGGPVVHVRVIARLVRMPERQIVATRGFERCFRAREDKVAPVVEAFDAAVGSVVKRLVTWTLTAVPRQVPIDGVPLPRRIADMDNDNVGCPKPGQPIDIPAAPPL